MAASLEVSTRQNATNKGLKTLDKELLDHTDQKVSSNCLDEIEQARVSSQHLEKKMLKYNKHEDKILTSKKGRASKFKMNVRRKKKISFDESVQVVPIPKRNEYSSRVRQRLWANADEIHKNAARNTIEFLSEG